MRVLKLLLLVGVLWVSTPLAIAQTPSVTWTAATVAASPFIEGAQAVDVDLGVVGGFVSDTTGTLYISSWTNNQIYQVSTSGRITIFAGIGGSSDGLPAAGDGGPARGARLSAPMGLCFDSLGNMYVADS